MSKQATIDKYAKSSGISKGTLEKVYKRGLGAYYSSGSRPKVSAHQWAAGRVRSFATGKGGARKADADLLRPKKSTKKKQEKIMKGYGYGKKMKKTKVAKKGKKPTYKKGRK